MNQTVRRAKERLYFGVTALSPRRISGRLSGPRIFANSVPKSGTNLLTTCLSQFPMLAPSFDHVTMNFNRRRGTAELDEKIGNTRRGTFTSGHVFYSEQNARIVESHEVDVLMIVRDPRDVVTSHFHYVAEKNTGHRLHRHYNSLETDHERLLASIRGVDAEHSDDGDRLESIGEWMERFTAWDQEEYVQIVRFEDLIGPEGGGDRERQIEAVRTIADHVSVDLTDDEVESIAENTFSPRSSTFRKGLIGDWRNHFASEHVEAFKGEANDALLQLGYEETEAWSP